MAFKAIPDADCDHYEERKSLPPGRLGTLRRRRKGATSPRASRRAGAKRPSLDTSNQLATSLLFWLQDSETAKDRRRKTRKLQDVLEHSHAKICNELELRLDELQSWEPGPELDREMEKVRAELQAWQRQWARLANCQSEWIGYKATCCDTALAVPIGCNHRLCFLCNSHRLQKYRERVKCLFDRLQHPVFLTLTVPNTVKLSKRKFSTLRRAWNQFRKTQVWIEGGIYAIETTYRKPYQPETPWHTHLHALCGAITALPQCKCGR